MQKIYYTGDFIRLDCAMKLAQWVASGGEAKIFITQEQVLVDGQPCTARGKKLHDGQTIMFQNQIAKIERKTKE